MLADWYFCCCIGLSGTAIRNILTLIDLLKRYRLAPAYQVTSQERVEEDETLLLVFKELHRSEVWIRIYAFPYVLTILQRTDSPVIRSTIQSYLRELWDLLPEREADGQAIRGSRDAGR